MAIIDIYSKRKKAVERGNQTEIYQYTSLPIEFRRQVIYIWKDAIGAYRIRNLFDSPSNLLASLKSPDTLVEPIVNRVWKSIYKLLARELGLSESSNPFEQCQSFLLDDNTNIDNLLDIIELTFSYIEDKIPDLLEEYEYDGIKLDQTATGAINELNYRFHEHGIGYQYIKGQIVRVDSLFIHAEAVIPALTLISEEDFIGAEQEFRSAHEHYRNQEYKAAIVEALKAFESTMKTICDKFNWDYGKKPNASNLIKVVLKEELIPLYLQDHLTSLTNVLQGGVPTVRNKTSGHGQGSEIKEVPEYLAAYVLHLTASNIVLLVEAYKAKSSG
ncbi:STM4504/CBY_0614 family protein [Pseudanabaena sp. ABRG5-3]|uniref:STM4504/CBY_0614 family protein n=1 Tax=Pseudanabaena sp. ABRG5-3 TaxID=685565 RepID=UPI000DC6F3D2|nr:hypothetical protein [Pseudanabaena sp. ABRG5-3]BBC24848.1 hypothetical protein ABRG53_2591 [Pseudanabaena sp. ABRG5-3]